MYVYIYVYMYNTCIIDSLCRETYFTINLLDKCTLDTWIFIIMCTGVHKDSGARALTHTTSQRSCRLRGKDRGGKDQGEETVGKRPGRKSPSTPKQYQTIMSIKKKKSLNYRTTWT